MGLNMTNPSKPSEYPQLHADQVIKDYRLAYKSRQSSIIGRREVLTGKAKFGIFGDGKEIVQLAMAHNFQHGDWRSGYYRDQTWLFALEILSLQEFFAQLYAHADVKAEPATAGRAMNSHFASRFINLDGSWKRQTEMFNIAADISPTGSQMPRLVGLAHASRLYRELPELQEYQDFSNEGSEIAWGTIGNASTAEGMFWESVNAIGVLRSPAIITIYDDGYGISVPNQFQMVKENIFDILTGFQRKPCLGDNCEHGFDLYTVHAWDYPALMSIFKTASHNARLNHIPALIHATEATQPQGHSTSGSHERYKSPERLAWEDDHDGLRKMREWIIEIGFSTDSQLNNWENEDRKLVENERNIAWEAFTSPIMDERDEAVKLLDEIAANSEFNTEIKNIRQELANIPQITRKKIHGALHKTIVATRKEFDQTHRQKIIDWKRDQDTIQLERYSSHLYSQTAYSALKVPEVKASYSNDSPTMLAFEILNACFDAALGNNPRVLAFGEDLGNLGDVNQAFRGLQEKY
jgi:TPP-dependent pyruvate/acetoin dehydrogenase alpha subunit